MVVAIHAVGQEYCSATFRYTARMTSIVVLDAQSVPFTKLLVYRIKIWFLNDKVGIFCRLWSRSTSLGLFSHTTKMTECIPHMPSGDDHSPCFYEHSIPSRYNNAQVKIIEYTVATFSWYIQYFTSCMLQAGFKIIDS